MSIINNEKDTKDYIKNYTTTKPNEMKWTKQDQKNWEKFKKQLPKLFQEALIFGIFATIFLCGMGYILYQFLLILYNL
tara:strand:+ start:3801 stop:4034 length:234 start_codon:yes stop_codon:yes gene_type:complete